MSQLTITIDTNTAKAIAKLNARYFFDLFKPIRTNEDEEYQYRDALQSVADAIAKASQ